MTSQKIVDSQNRNGQTGQVTEQTIHLKRPVFVSYIVASLIVGAGLGLGAWAAIARFEQKVLATGTLEQQQPTKEIKALTDGVVQEIYVKEGQEVAQEQPLATFKPTVTEADLASLKKQKETLIKVNQLYENALKGSYPVDELNLPPLVQLRDRLEQEAQYYQALVTDKNLESAANGEFNAKHQRLIAASSPEVQSRVSAARLQIQDLEKQLLLVKEKLAVAQKRAAFNQDMFERLTQASKEVDVPRQQYQRQKQELLTAQEDVERLSAEQKRLTQEITQVKEIQQNAIALAAKDVLAKISQNQRQILQIDAQLKPAQQDNQKRIAEIDAKLKTLVQPQQLKSPVEGVVFDLQPKAAGTVATANQTLLTVVPNNSLVASVFLKDRDVGLVKKGMDVKVKMSSFPKSEMGSTEGKVLWVGSDVLPPTPERSYYAIPARIQLERPALDANGNSIRLQSGMAVNGEIILPQQRTVWDIVRDNLDKKMKNLMELVS